MSACFNMAELLWNSTVHFDLSGVSMKNWRNCCSTSSEDVSCHWMGRTSSWTPEVLCSDVWYMFEICCFCSCTDVLHHTFMYILGYDLAVAYLFPITWGVDWCQSKLPSCALVLGPTLLWDSWQLTTLRHHIAGDTLVREFGCEANKLVMLAAWVLCCSFQVFLSSSTVIPPLWRL